jgi:uncharacterized membrane protein
MKILTCLLLMFITCILIPVSSFSQKHFLPGYVVDARNDTIKGLIDYRNWNRTPKEISFKAGVDSKEFDYSPNTIKKFGVENEIYVSGIVSYDDSPFYDSQLSVMEESLNRIDTVFLQLLAVGEKSLYYFKDKNKKEHFFIMQNGNYELLVYRKYLETVEGIVYNKTNEIYKGQLTVYFQDCPLVRQKINSSTYSKNAFIKLFDEYYSGKGDQMAYKADLSKFRMESGLIAGISLANIRFKGDKSFTSLINADFHTSVNPVLGGFVNIVFPRTGGNLSFNNELIYTSFKFTGHYFELTPDDHNIYTFTDNSIAYSYVKLNNLLKLNIPFGKLSIFINGGISDGIVLSSTNYKRTESHVYSIVDVDERAALAKTRNWEKGYVAGMGTSFGRYSLEFRYEHGDGMSGFMLLNSPVTRFYLLARYKF